MKLEVFCVLLVLSSVALGDGNKHTPKRLKITPNLELEDAWSFNLELNVYRDVSYLNTGIDYSGFSGWDFNITTYSIPISGNGSQLSEYDTYLGISKTFDITEDMSISFGSQNGTTLLANSNRHWHNLTYCNITYQIIPTMNAYVGPYYANANLTYSGNQVGVITGMEWKVIQDKFHITGDYVSGHQSVSGATINFQYIIIPNLQLYVGIIVPETNSGNEFAGVVGFNVSTKDI